MGPTWRPWWRRSSSTLSGWRSRANGSWTFHQRSLWRCSPATYLDLERRCGMGLDRGSLTLCREGPHSYTHWLTDAGLAGTGAGDRDLRIGGSRSPTATWYSVVVPEADLRRERPIRCRDGKM